MAKLKTGPIKVSYVTIVNGGKIRYQVRTITPKKSFLKADPGWSKYYVIFAVQGGWSHAVGHTESREDAYAHARMCREYGCIY